MFTLCLMACILSLLNLGCSLLHNGKTTSWGTGTFCSGKLMNRNACQPAGANTGCSAAHWHFSTSVPNNQTASGLYSCSYTQSAVSHRQSSDLGSPSCGRGGVDEWCRHYSMLYQVVSSTNSPSLTHQDHQRWLSGWEPRGVLWAPSSWQLCCRLPSFSVHQKVSPIFTTLFTNSLNCRELGFGIQASPSIKIFHTLKVTQCPQLLTEPQHRLDNGLCSKYLLPEFVKAESTFS